MAGRYETLRPKLNELRLSILTNGPTTVYEAYRRLGQTAKMRKRSRPPLATVDRHLKILLDQQEIEVFEESRHKSGQMKKTYGLTPYGFLRSFRIPDARVLQQFKGIANIWFHESKFRFIVPNEEALTAVNTSKEVAHQMARYCQFIANLFGEAEDFLDCFIGAGYNEKESPEKIIEISTQLAWLKYGRRFTECFKVLTANLPTLASRVRIHINAQRENLDSMERYLFA